MMAKVNRFYKYFIPLCALAIVPHIVNAQSKISGDNRHKVEVRGATSDSIKAMLDEYEKVELPPLSVFLASAEEHSSLQVYKSRVKAARAEKDLINRKWFDFVKFSANYSYGYNNLLNNFFGTDDMILYDRSASATHRYSMGVSVAFSLGDILNHKYEQRKKQAQLEELEYQYQMSLESRKLVILQSYNEVVEQLATIKVKAEAAALYNAQMSVSETDFANGKIDIISLSLERSRRSNALSIYQSARVTLHNAITLLEMLTNVTIIKK